MDQLVVLKPDEIQRMSGLAPNDPNDKGETPIHLAAMNNQLEMVQLLITGNPNSQDNWRLTPIHEAAKRGYLEIVRDDYN